MIKENIDLRKIPSVNILLEELIKEHPQIKPVYLKRLILTELGLMREHPKRYGLHKYDKKKIQQILIEKLSANLINLTSGTLKQVINATGVVLHTGLGRAPVNPQTISKLSEIRRYTNLEINLKTGKRGERNDHLAPLLKILSGAEDGLAVNNNAAAVMLMLNTIGYRKEVIISRGEMIEIGGSFRLPEVFRFSGCKLREIGTTNRTHLQDYEQAINKKIGGILICHPSNYEVSGFTHKPELHELVNLAGRHNLPLIYDLGSGSLIHTEQFGSAVEPQVSQIVESGVDLLSFSGDKLLGGPQAGLIVGKKEWVKKCAKNHLMRALRLDKFIIKALQETLIRYLAESKVTDRLDALSALILPADKLRERCEAFVASMPASISKQCTVIKSSGKVGSGAYPILELDSYAVRIQPDNMTINSLANRLRNFETPVFTYISDEAVFIDLRAVTESEENILKDAVSQSLK